MPPRIQNPRVLDQIEDPLRLSERPLSTPAIDPGQIALVYPLSPAELATSHRLFYTAATTLNGATALFTDCEVVGASVVLSWFNGLPSVDQFRKYQFIQATLAGGTVTPILARIEILIPGTAAIVVHTELVANPGYLNFAVPVRLAQRGWQLRLNFAAGGAGDTVTVNGSAYVADFGVPLPVD